MHTLTRTHSCGSYRGGPTHHTTVPTVPKANPDTVPSVPIPPVNFKGALVKQIAGLVSILILTTINESDYFYTLQIYVSILVVDTIADSQYWQI